MIARALAVAAALCASGCYLSHGPGRAPDAAARDAGSPAADAARRCDESKLRTHGLVEPWAPGSGCDQLVACVDTFEAIEAARFAFPGLACRDAPDPACMGLGASSCLVWVDRLSDEEYDAACALTLRSDVAALVCSGDL